MIIKFSFCVPGYISHLFLSSQKINIDSDLKTFYYKLSALKLSS